MDFSSGWSTSTSEDGGKTQRDGGQDGKHPEILDALYSLIKSTFRPPGNCSQNPVCESLTEDAPKRLTPVA